MKSIATFDKLAKSSKLARREGAFLVFRSKIR
jgi:hypothetical protein